MHGQNHIKFILRELTRQKIQCSRTSDDIILAVCESGSVRFIWGAVSAISRKQI